jgi:hypothetical protein
MKDEEAINDGTQVLGEGRDLPFAFRSSEYP